MLKNKTKMFLLFSLLLITMIGMTAISAADADNATADAQISDASSQVGNTISEITASDNNNKAIEKTDNIKTVKKEGESGTLADLNTAITDAEDTITLTQDYTATDSEQPFEISKDITIDGNGKTITAVNGALTIPSGNTVNIKNLVFAGKNGSPAMITIEGTLNLENVSFKDCFSTTSSYPAVMEVKLNSVLTMDSCSINNTCSTTAPIRMQGAVVTIKNTNITNVISRNAIVYVSSSTTPAYLNFDGCVLANAKDSNYGGAIYDNGAGTLIVNNTIIENNTANSRGGGIFSKANTTLTNSIIRNNTLTAASYNRPEGVWLDSSNAVLTVSNNTFTDNHCSYDEVYYLNNGKMNSTVKVTVATYSFEEDETPVLIAFVTDENGNKIGDRLGKITFDVDGKTYESSTIENGTAYVVANDLEVDNSFIVTASYSNAPEELQQATGGKIEYGNVLPPMTDYTSMQAIVDELESASVLKLNNNITRAESETKVVIDKDLTIDGKKLTIDANKGTVFEIKNGATVTIKNIKITNAEAANAINITNGNVVLDNVVIDDSTVTNVYNQYGLISVKSGSSLVINNSKIETIKGVLLDNMANTTIENTSITNCDSTGSGNQPAIILEKGNLTILNSEINDNIAYSGLIYSTPPSMKVTAMNGSLIIDNTKFINNTITQGSSVVSVSNKTTINASLFENNKALRASGANGSAVTISYDVMNITNSIFVNNTASGDVSTAYVGINGTLDISNSILLSNDNKPLITPTNPDSAVAILNNNYWGINGNPTHSSNNLVVTQIEDEDYWGDIEIINLKVTLDNWIVQETTLTENPDDNSIFAVETTFKLNNTQGTLTDLTENLPEGLEVTYTATDGSFDQETVAVTENKATNTYYAGRTDSTVTVAVPQQEQTFDVTAPVIDPKNYIGLQKLITATPNGETLELEKDCTRAESENNVTIENKNIVIDGKGFTIDENNGRFLMIQNSNVTLKNLIIKNAGTIYNPSVLQIWTGNLVMENVTIIDSTASTSQGALVYVSSDSNATINNVTFANNTARFISASGTTIINNSVIENTLIDTSSRDDWGYFNGKIKIENTVFNNNTGYSAAITTGSNYSASLYLNNVTFSNNNVTSTSTSGSLINSQVKLTMNNTRVENNYAQGSSSVNGFFYLKSTSTVDNSTFINNKVSGTSNVAGLFYMNGRNEKLTINNSIFINNTGANKGNIIYNYYGRFEISNSVILNNSNDTYKIAIYNYDTGSYANNNWWGTNNSPRDYVYEHTSTYKIHTENWVIMEAEATDAEDGVLITTTFNKVTDADGTISDLEGSLPDGFEVTYEATTGTLKEETTLVENGQTTNTITPADGSYEVTVTQAQESITLSATQGGDLIITDETYPDFFNEDGTPKDVITAGSVVYLSGPFTNKDFVFDIPVNLTTAEDQAILNNARIIFNEDASGSNMTGLVVNDTNYAEVAVFINEATDINITNNTIIQYNADGTTIAIAFNQTTGTTIEANNISISGKAYKITSVELLSTTAAIQGYNSSENFILDNDINAVGLGNGGRESDQTTMIGIEVRGEYYIDYDTYDMAFDESNENLISDNRITVSGDSKYNYGIRFGNNVDGTIINNNTINVTGTIYACGVEVGKSDDSQILYNNITATADNFTYGIFISTNNMGAVNTATVYQNIINLTAKDNYGVELYGPDETTISENVIYATGDYSLGIAGYNSDENTITDNNITVIGDSSKDKQLTADQITQDIIGITLLAFSSAEDSTITGNIITVTDVAGNDAYAITIKGADNTITDNTLVGTNTQGNNAVNASEENTVSDNLPSNELTITAESQTVATDSVIDIEAIVKDSEGNDVTTGTVTFTVGEDSTDVAVVDGKAVFEFTASQTSDITITYNANGLYDEKTTTITITAEGNPKAVITVEDVEGFVGEDITITASVTDKEGNAIEGTVIFTDDENNVIGVASIENGVATITYKSNDMGAKEITATFQGNDDFEESSTTAQVTINQPETIIVIDEFTATAGQNVTITARITYGDTLVSGGKVAFKVNGKTLKDENGKVIYATVKDGIATINYTIPSEWAGKSLNVTAVYSGSSKYSSARSEAVVVDVAKSGVNLAIEPITGDVKVGSNITIKATVKDGDKEINTGKVAFKLNGKTLKDANGKVLYFNVVNGEVSFDYTLASNLKAGEYKLTAVYSSAYYDKTEAETTVNIIK